MYIDGWVLLLIYTMAAASLIISLYIFLDHRDFVRRMSKKPPQKTYYQPPPVVTKKPKGHWD